MEDLGWKRLLQAAEEGSRTGSMIEILVLRALASQTQGDSPAALASLQRALTLAEPEGYVRTFDLGPPYVCCGVTTATAAPHLAILMGHRSVTFFGCDSSFGSSSFACSFSSLRSSSLLIL